MCMIFHKNVSRHLSQYYSWPPKNGSVSNKPVIAPLQFNIGSGDYTTDDTLHFFLMKKSWNTCERSTYLGSIMWWITGLRGLCVSPASVKVSQAAFFTRVFHTIDPYFSLIFSKVHEQWTILFCHTVISEEIEHLTLLRLQISMFSWRKIVVRKKVALLVTSYLFVRFWMLLKRSRRDCQCAKFVSFDH